jgi:hypothetical protein
MPVRMVDVVCEPPCPSDESEGYRMVDVTSAAINATFLLKKAARLASLNLPFVYFATEVIVPETTARLAHIWCVCRKKRYGYRIS